MKSRAIGRSPGLKIPILQDETRRPSLQHIRYTWVSPYNLQNQPGREWLGFFSYPWTRGTWVEPQFCHFVTVI